MRKAARKLKASHVQIPASELPGPILTYLSDEQTWRLEETYLCEHGGHTIRVPGGFTFDLASIPRVFWWLAAPFELSIAAPLLHDFLYRYGGSPPAGSVTPERAYTRKEADLLFRAIMEEEGVPPWRRIPAYYAVRWFAGGSWQQSD